MLPWQRMLRWPSAGPPGGRGRATRWEGQGTHRWDECSVRRPPPHGQHGRGHQADDDEGGGRDVAPADAAHEQAGGCRHGPALGGGGGGGAHLALGGLPAVAAQQGGGRQPACGGGGGGGGAAGRSAAVLVGCKGRAVGCVMEPAAAHTARVGEGGLAAAAQGQPGRARRPRRSRRGARLTNDEGRRCAERLCCPQRLVVGGPTNGCEGQEGHHITSNQGGHTPAARGGWGGGGGGRAPAMHTSSDAYLAAAQA